MGRIAWYGSNNDQDNASLAWSIGVNPDGGTWTAGSNRKGYMTFNNHNGEQVRINSGGNVGIGTDNPQRALHVNGGDIRISDNSARLEFFDTNASNNTECTGGIEIFDKNGNRGVYMGATDGANEIAFGISPSAGAKAIERLRIQSDGKVILGGNANQANRNLSVVAASGNSNEAQIGLQPTNSSGGYNPEVFISAIADGTYGAHMYFKTRDTSGNRLERLRIQSDGILQIINTWQHSRWNILCISNNQ